MTQSQRFTRCDKQDALKHRTHLLPAVGCRFGFGSSIGLGFTAGLSAWPGPGRTRSGSARGGPAVPGGGGGGAAGSGGAAPFRMDELDEQVSELRLSVEPYLKSVAQ